MKKISFFLSWISFLLLFSSCFQEDDSLMGKKGSGNSTATIEAVVKPFNTIQVQTRSTGKNEQERKVTSLHLFLFDKNGAYLTSKSGYEESNQQHQFITTGSFTIKRDIFNDQTAAKTAKVCMVGNIPEEEFSTNVFDKIPNLKALHDYMLQKEMVTLSNEGLLLYGEREIDLSSSQKTETSTDVFTIDLKSLYARIDVNLSMNPTQVDGTYPRFQMTSYELHNLPKNVRLEERSDETTGDNFKHFNQKDLQIPGNTTLQDGSSVSFSFYMLEQLLNPVADEPEGGYPNGINEDEKQRFKPALAPATATYIEFKGLYTNINHTVNTASFKVYLGANHTNDFNIQRNCIYVNNIAITGITNNDSDHHTGTDYTVSYDMRVHVSNEKFMVSVERETKLDCHIEMRPMDLYLAAPGSRIEVNILDAQNKPWVRLEKKNSATLLETGYCSNGKQKYFTTDLLTSKLVNNTSATINDAVDNRIWLYFDENLDVSTTNTREAIVQIKYYDKDATEPTEVVNHKFIQHALYPVTYEGRTYYTEYYEEYLYNFDPKDPYTNRKEGMPWGLSGVQLSDTEKAFDFGNSFLGSIFNIFTSSVRPYYDFDNSKHPYYGWNYTKKIINKSGYTVLDYNTIPRSAAEYCYNKNKRNDDGTISESDYHWYLPGTDEIEDIARGSYTTFKDFQNNYYWSSQPAYDYCSVVHLWKVETCYKDNIENARATKIKYQDNNYDIITSDLTEQNMKITIPAFASAEDITYKKIENVDFPEGVRSRTEELRVRAIRKMD